MALRSFARILRDALKKRGMTQASLREAAGISRQTMSNVLSGTSDYKLSTLFAVADRLGLDVVLVPKDVSYGLSEPDTMPTAPTSVRESAARFLSIAKERGGLSPDAGAKTREGQSRSSSSGSRKT
ncbi:MAG: helix-turn-helix transcriptional regulator [Candidimonas sp.]|jgi:transcriptional regulator with XRE-family HTH domain